MTGATDSLVDAFQEIERTTALHLQWITEQIRRARVALGGWQEDATLDRPGPPYGPRNTWSNAAYGLAGLGIYFAQPSLETGILMAFCWLLMFGSGLFHAFKTTYHNLHDHVGMYAVFGGLAAFGLGGGPFLMLVAGFGLAWVGTYVQQKVPLDTLIGVLLAPCLIPVALADWTYALATLALYGVSYVAQRLDHAKSPHTSVWGHAIWHVGSAGAIWMTGMGLL